MTDTDADQYRDEWAGLTGCSPSEVYIPAALRDTDEEFGGEDG
jgi:hypothetical protein